MTFTAAEYADRLARTRAAMAARGIEVLVVSDPSNMAWLTGYDGWSFYVHQAVVLGRTGKPIWWGRAMDAAGARRTIPEGSAEIVGYDDIYVQNPARHPMGHLAQILQDRGLAGGNIGVELDNYYFSAAAYLELHKTLGDRLVEATALVNWQRAVKSAAELGLIRQAGRVVTRMHEAIRDMARPGLPKNALVAEILRVGTLGVDGIWGDYPAIVPMAPSGLDATAPHLTWDDRPMQAGEAHFFEISGVVKRYHCPQSRTVFFEDPPARYRRAEAAVLEATEAGLAAAKPGNTCEDVAAAFNGALNRLGFEKDSRCGYSIGLSYPPDWGERTMSLRAGDLTELKPGMVFHFMPALWLEDGGIELTETIEITATGAHRICDTPTGIAVV